MATVTGPDGRTHYVYTISGVRVEFPAKAYPSQISMMDKVIRGLKNKQHCLLESPTGSGKTLALLCASLAWQRAEAENVRKYNESIEAQMRSSFSKPVNHGQNVKQEKVKEEPRLDDTVSPYFTDDNSDDDFQPIIKRKTNQPSKLLPASETTVTVTTRSTAKPEKMHLADAEAPSLDDEMNNGEPIHRRQRIPKIFFGTRTHKQIAQVVKEFKRTVYASTPMDVLASREHTCIHPEVSKGPNKNEGCKALNDPRQRVEQKTSGCVFRHRGKEKMHDQDQLRRYGFKSGWDIEDLVGLGRKIRCCPYYASRDLMEQAHIIFSPYNYLIDPRVRSSMKIPLNDNIIILDEAHNIEDAARESAGGSWTHEEFKLALQDCEKIGKLNRTMAREVDQLAGFSSYMMNWMDRQAKASTSVGIDREVSIMSGTEFIASLDVDGYGPERMTELKQTVDQVFAEQQAESEWIDPKAKKEEEPHLSAATEALFNGFFMVLDLVIGENQIHRDDYRAVVTKTIERKRNNRNQNNFFGQTSSQWTYTLNLWCMNPAVVLKDVRTFTRSIVVTSGTLSPLNSYQSELGIDFRLTLEANHVIPADRVWIGSVATGPRNVLLNGTFRSVSTFEYQDELGVLVLNVCRTVPHGVLCFLPSYHLLEKLASRWQDTGLWNELAKSKTIVCESRQSDAFEETLRHFYDAIDDSEKSMQWNEADDMKLELGNGALMFAVCRGKVSEGLDFTDNRARAVICVGIPFPSFKDTQVELKRKYNDVKSVNTPMLNGSEWYEIQAFRALNQALGRCIRHKNDWGAILLVDDRFGKMQRYSNQLSKWARNNLNHYKTFGSMMDSLKMFTDKFAAQDVADYRATQASNDEKLMAIYDSPVKSAERECKEVESPDVMMLTDDESDDDPRPYKRSVANMMTPVRKKPFATLITSGPKMSAAQVKLAAEHGSRYFCSQT